MSPEEREQMNAEIRESMRHAVRALRIKIKADAALIRKGMAVYIADGLGDVEEYANGGCQ